MKSAYRIESAGLAACDEAEARVFLYSSPTEAEKEEILRMTALEQGDLEGIFDPDEVARLEHSEDGTLLIWKRPDNVTTGNTIQFEVSSLGIVLMNGRLIVIMPHGTLVMTGKEFRKVTSVENCLLRMLLQSVHQYQGHLKAIKLMSQELQAKIVASMENRYLLQMFTLGESLIYYFNALAANNTVLLKLRTLFDKLKVSPEDIELLDDVIVENQQASKQAEIYSTVLSGLMDARGSIVNNNMNVLLKNLTVINVVFMPLNLVASIGGMSEYSMMTQGIHWAISYGAFIMAMLLLGCLTWSWLTRVIEHRHIGANKTA